MQDTFGWLQYGLCIDVYRLFLLQRLFLLYLLYLFLYSASRYKLPKCMFLMLTLNFWIFEIIYCGPFLIYKSIPQTQCQTLTFKRGLNCASLVSYLQSGKAPAYWLFHNYHLLCLHFLVSLQIVRDQGLIKEDTEDFFGYPSSFLFIYIFFKKRQTVCTS